MTAKWIKDICSEWRKFYSDQVTSYPDLNDYVQRATQKIADTKPATYLSSKVLDIFYHILNHEPFVSWVNDPEKALRLGYLTKVLEAYTSTPIPGFLEIDRGSLRTSKETKGELSWLWRSQFYNALVTLMVQQGVNDPENDEVVYPRGSVPFMTVHQAKGLEFPVVFVARTDEEARTDAQHIIEEETNEFRKTLISYSGQLQRAREDLIRFYYVAYSRAQFALLLLLNSPSLNPGEGAGKTMGLGGGDINWLKKRARCLGVLDRVFRRREENARCNHF